MTQRRRRRAPPGPMLKRESNGAPNKEATESKVKVLRINVAQKRSHHLRRKDTRHSFGMQLKNANSNPILKTL